MNTAERTATNKYSVRPAIDRFGKRAWALCVLLDDDTEDKLSNYPTRIAAMTTGRMLAGRAGSCVAR